ncbi:MAG: DNA repair protein RecN [Sphaerochaeta sp.]|jgi:DNA repair protein RecN (Recombination protein N)|nr:DNA repair protein RecN [Sphaerochaeta sp.]PKL28983.1 MAG: DNA repair protein RecN [Spirochaetae bacterium HGW-Spirochaetae-2]
MLESLDIRNLALIEDIHIDFQPGFNVLTGETGAGKSIILGALGLLLGEKADGSIVRTGAAEASVSAVVSVERTNPLLHWLEERDIEPDEGSILIHRVVKNSGRGSILVQSVPMTRADLTVISDALFDMHGQHEHQSLLNSDRQRRVLDSYGEIAPYSEAYAKVYRELENLQLQRSKLQEDLASAGREEDYLRFVSEELQRAQLKTEEDTELEDEIRILSQYEIIHENLELVYDNLKNSTGEGAIAALGQALQSCRRATKADPSLDEIDQRLESLLLETQDIAESIRDRLSSMSFSQSRLDELQSRLSQLQRLKKKYGPSLDAVIAFRDQTLDKLAQLTEHDGQLGELEKEILALEQVVAKAAGILTKRREESAKRLQEQIAARLVHLGMPHVVFSIDIQPRTRTIHGADQVDFLFSANLGEPKRSLKEIASGGELSRVMLAVKTVLAEADDVETLVFDEVDAGIGGSVAIAVGQQMAELAKSRQVIAITHLASIAAKAGCHLVVSKETSGGRTYTRIEEVVDESRVKEIARMLSGKGQDETALAHARSLMR